MNENKFRDVTVDLALVMTNDLALRINASDPETCRRLTGHEEFRPAPMDQMADWLDGLADVETAVPAYCRHHACEPQLRPSRYHFGLTSHELAAAMVRRHARVALGRDLPVRKAVLFSGTLTQTYPEHDYLEELNGDAYRPVLYYFDVSDFVKPGIVLGQLFDAKSGERPDGLLKTPFRTNPARYLACVEGTALVTDEDSNAQSGKD